MRKFAVLVYDDNDISDQEIYVELQSRFGNMIACVVEEVSKNEAQPQSENESQKTDFNISPA